MNIEKFAAQRKWLAPLAIAVGLAWLFPGPCALAVKLTLGAAAIGFLLNPLKKRLEKFMSASVAALLSVAIAAVAVVGVVALFLPTIVMQVIDLIGHLDHWIDVAVQTIDGAAGRFEGMGIKLPQMPGEGFDLLSLVGDVNGFMDGTAQLAGSIAGGAMNLGLSVMLGVYFLLDWDNLLIRAEMLIPSRARPLTLRMAGEAGRGLRAYLRGQVLISLIVGALAAVGLVLIGVKSALALGTLVGILNMIPYFGPILGGIPAVLAALSQDLIVALMAVAVLFVVQQIDGMLISPRVMSGVTGLSPAVVLLALSVGGSGWGIMGMLLALPVVIIVRICFRVWATRNEVIEKPPNV